MLTILLGTRRTSSMLIDARDAAPALGDVITIGGRAAHPPAAARHQPGRDHAEPGSR